MENLEEVLVACKKDRMHPDRSALIHSFTPFIIKTITNVTGSYVDENNSDELTVGMLAFDEAISQYDGNKGSFVNYASLLISSRVRDYMRQDTFSLRNTVVANEKLDEFQAVKENHDMKYEIDLFNSFLQDFGIDIESLTQKGPKHEAVRRELIALCREMSGNQDLMRMMYSKGKLPMAAIGRKYGISKKRLKSHREFIIAATIIYEKNLSLISEYLGGGGENE